MRPELRRYTTRLLAGLTLSAGAAGLSRAEEPPTDAPAAPAFSLRSFGSRTALPAAVELPAPAAGPVQLPPAVADAPPAGPVVPPPVPGPAVPAPPPAADCDPCGPAPVDWKKVPPVVPMPRLGWFMIPPAGPGYYSFADVLHGRWRDKPPPLPYGPVSVTPWPFFDADFRYLEDPTYPDARWADQFKRIHFCDNWMLGLGGEFRYRLMDEQNSRLLGVNQTYHQLRYRAYADLWFRDRLRAYVEFISADSYNMALPPLAIDRNPADLMNLFVDFKLADVGGAPLVVRAGRQELLLGSQRLVSPLDWANTRRTFQGVRGLWHSAKWDFDVFWTKPVVVNPNQLDNWDTNQNFSGGWLTYKFKPGTAWDAYVLNRNNGAPVAVGRNGVAGGFDVTTFGTRVYGDVDGRWLFDTEAMLQTGIRANQDVTAGAYTVGAGYRAKCHRWNPSVWAYYDWASGEENPGGPGRWNTFNQLFPFGHYYMGYLDLVGRQNIHDVNFQLAANPRPWILTLLQFHNFWLASPRDALYNAAGVPIRRSPAGVAGTFVGQELDFIVNFHLSQRQDILVGWSHLFAGPFIRNTGVPNSPTLYYFQYSLKW